MAKIFLSFYNGVQNPADPRAMPLFYESFIQGLKQQGHEIFAFMGATFEHDFSNIPAGLLKQMKDFNPDLIFHFNNYFYDISQEFDCPIVIYEVDSPLYYSNPDRLKQNPSRYKFFVASSSSIEILENDFRVPAANIIQIPFFTQVQAQDLPTKYNICFIGTKFGKNGYDSIHRFINLNPTEQERKTFKCLVQRLEQEVFVSKTKLLQGITSDKILETFEPDDIISSLSAHRRLHTLASLVDLGLDLWGTLNWKTDAYEQPWLKLNYHDTPVYSLAHNQFIYNSSKIGFNIGHLQARNGFPWRVFDIMASNACLVTQCHQDLQQYLPGLKLPCYEDAYQARQLCQKILKEENYRLDIVRQSQQIINEKYRFKHVLKTMEQFLDMPLSAGKISHQQTPIIYTLMKQNIPVHVPAPDLKHRLRTIYYALLLVLAQIFPGRKEEKWRDKIQHGLTKYWRV